MSNEEIQNTEKPVKPELRNPNTAANWSLVFTPIFGAWLHAENWKNLNEPERAKKSMLWVYAGFVFLLIVLFMPNNTGSGPGVIFLLFWYFTSARKQVKYIQKKEIEYEKKSWKKPLLIGLAGIVVYGCICFLAVASEPNDIELRTKQIMNEKMLPKFRSYSGNSSLECVQVELGKEFADDNYYATATFNDGDKIRLTVQVKEKELIVQIKGAVEEGH